MITVIVAYEVLSNPQKRRAFDSVDPLFDETIPTGTLTYKENFFKLYSPAFERNERCVRMVLRGTFKLRFPGGQRRNLFPNWAMQIPVPMK